MRHNPLSRLALIASAVFLFMSVGCEDHVNFVNSAPSNLNISVSKCFVEVGGTVSLSGSATDDDMDSLTYSWTATKGTFNPPSGKGRSVTWTAPPGQGPVTIKLGVTDDIATSYKSVGVVACLPFPALSGSLIPIGDPGDFLIVLGDTPYKIPGSTEMVISKGVTVIFDSEFGGFDVGGRVFARGTPDDRIVFRGNSCGDGEGTWGGMTFSGMASCLLRNVDMTQSEEGIHADAGGQLDLDSCQIYDNTIGVSATLHGSRATIRHCIISENGTGVYLQNSEADIRSSSIRYNGLNGIEISISLESTPVAIESCIVANNGVSGIQLGEAARPEIHDCSIFSNGANAGETNYGIKLASYTATDTIHAEYNFWGLGYTTAQKIPLVIYDKTDNPALAAAYVSFTPWLNSGPVMSAPRGAKSGKGSAWAR